MKEYVNFPNLVLVSYVAKMFLIGTSLSDSLIITALAGFCSFYYYLQTKKEDPINVKFKAELTELKTELDLLKSTLNSVRLGNITRS